MHSLPTQHAHISTDNWAEQLNKMATESAYNVLKQLSPATSLELAFATLQAYFTIAYATSLPFIEDDGTANARFNTLRDIIASCGIELETTITNVEIPPHV